MRVTHSASMEKYDETPVPFDCDSTVGVGMKQGFIPEIGCYAKEPIPGYDFRHQTLTYIRTDDGGVTTFLTIRFNRKGVGKIEKVEIRKAN